MSPPNGGRKHPEQALQYIETEGILFIIAGAFVGIDDIIRRRHGQHSVGFGAKATEGRVAFDAELQKNPLSRVSHQDLRDFGLIPELVGRFPIITHVDPLGENDLCRILTEPVDALVNQYTALLTADKVDLSFTPEALRTIAATAIDEGTGARGLRSVMERVMGDIMFNAPDYRSGRNRIKVIVDCSQVETALAMTSGGYRNVS